VQDVTHIFYTAFVETGDDAKNVDVNFGMFKTAIEVRSGFSVRQAPCPWKHASGNTPAFKGVAAVWSS